MKDCTYLNYKYYNEMKSLGCVKIPARLKKLFYSNKRDYVYHVYYYTSMLTKLNI